jgi:serine/threonine protein kinase/DNA-binding beta-propeller fold protein YncE
MEYWVFSGGHRRGEHGRVAEGTPAPGGFGIGSHIAGYRLDEPIGRGGMAVVYRAYDSRLERRVALKILAPELARDQEFQQRFIRESRAAAAVDHPNIIPIFEAGEAKGVLFIAMRFVDGRDVQTLIEQQGRLPADRVCTIVTQVAAALDSAHAHGLVHRDVKPANMLRDAASVGDRSGNVYLSDHVYLSDFGLSKQSLSSTGLTSKGHFLGTLNYVSPEQIEGRPVDGRADQYALACSAFEMLCGEPPFKRDETLATMWAQMSAAPPALTSRCPSLPAAVDEVMAKALAKNPDDRYASCLEFATALRRACGLEPAPAAPPVTPGRSPTQAVSAADLASASAASEAPPPAPAAGQAAPPPVPVTGQAPPKPPGPAPVAASAGPPTQAVRLPGDGTTTPEAPPGQPSGYPPGGGGRRRRRAWPAILAAAVVAVAAAGAYLALGRGGGGGSHPAATLLPPGCATKVAKAAALPESKVPTHLVHVGGNPFDVAAAANGFGFVSLGDSGLAVMDTTRPVPRLRDTVPVNGAQGMAITPNQKYLLVTTSTGLTVFRVADLERGGTAPAGSLAVPRARHPVEVTSSPDSKFAFVTVQDSNEVAVFDLAHALSAGFGPSALVGTIPMKGKDPVGIAASTDGKYLYVASGLDNPASTSAGGTLTVLGMRKAEKNPKNSVLHTLNAGCGPARVLAAPDGKHVWVTVGGSNALLAYSASKLASGDARHALLAKITVGYLPLGLALVAGGQRIVLANSDRDHVPGGVSNLAVVNVPKALAGRPAVVGVIKSGKTPRQFALERSGKILLVTNTDSGQLQSVNLAHLP